MKKASSVGLDGMLTLDLPPEECDDLFESCRMHDLKNIFIVAPTTPQDRIPLIVENVPDLFIMYLARVLQANGALS